MLFMRYSTEEDVAALKTTLCWIFSSLGLLKLYWDDKKDCLLALGSRIKLENYNKHRIAYPSIGEEYSKWDFNLILWCFCKMYILLLSHMYACTAKIDITKFIGYSTVARIII